MLGGCQHQRRSRGQVRLVLAGSAPMSPAYPGDLAGQGHGAPIPPWPRTRTQAGGGTGDFSWQSCWTCWPKGSCVTLGLPKWHPVSCIQLKVGCNCPDCTVSGCQEYKAGLAGTESPALSQAAGLQPAGPCQLVSLHPDLPAQSPGRKYASHGACPPGQVGGSWSPRAGAMAGGRRLGSGCSCC